MERIQSINPKRIEWCCADVGITPDELASELGITAASFQRVMAGEDGLTFNQLSKLSEYFGRGMMFFLEPSLVDAEKVHTPAFRTLANQKPELSAKIKRLIERVEGQRSIYLSLREDLDESELPSFKPPSLPQSDPRAAARVARGWLGVTDENNFDSYRTAVEAQGMLVFRSNGYGGKWQIAKENPILGFAIYDRTCPVILVKKQIWESKQTFTLMHELGHILLHKASSIDDENDMQSREGWERNANAFAGYLLVPDEFLAAIDDADRPEEVSQYDDWLKQFRTSWGVSTEVILRRLLDGKRLTQNKYTAYRKWRNNVPLIESESGSRAYRHREPKHIFGDVFVRAVLDALNSSHITLPKASTYLDGLKIKDLHKLEQHYAGV
jgi:Zn-dependent peptidase ImmA (M78 family)/plasmid maintenance system antidote protein VapI